MSTGIYQRFGQIYKFLLGSVLGCMVLIVFVNVVLRKFFHSGISFTEEGLRYLFVWMSYLGIVAAYKTNDHIRVTMLVDHLPARVHAALGLVMNAVILYALWFCIDGGFVYIEANAGTYGELIKVPYYLVIFSIIFACLSIGAMAIVEMVGQARFLLRGESR
jgi:TRAP-type C4-dicarboxylate transport system permease small subunit